MIMFWPYTVLLASILLKVVQSHGCTNYTLLDTLDRSRFTPRGSNSYCDKQEGWYRFSGDAGSQIATTCVPKKHCGTYATGWMQGSHPSSSEGIVSRKVCYTWNRGCCHYSNFIDVRNCGNFFVYKLFRSPVCPLRYCGNGIVDCAFDGKSLCNWVQMGKNAIWKLSKSKSSNAKTGPTQDVSGNGYFAYIDSSSNTIYNAKAVLTSPVFNGPKQITFYYHMYGSTVESLEVTVKTIIGKRALLWRLSGNQGNVWKKGCVNMNYTEDYQVLFEAMFGASDTADIAIDNLKVNHNITEPCDDHKQYHSENSHNCNFIGTLCGWRNIANKYYMDGLKWKFGNRSEQGGNVNHYIFASSPIPPLNQGQSKAYLISPLLFSPYCLTTNYSIEETGIIEIILTDMETGPNKLYVFDGTTNGEQTGVQVSLSYAGVYQVIIIGTPKGNATENIAISGVEFVPGLCEEKKDKALIHGNCSFESSSLTSGLGLWLNEKKDDFDWTVRKGWTPSSYTGPHIYSGERCRQHAPDPVSPKEGDIRLMCGRSANEGRVEIFHAYIWGTVSGKTWTNNEGKVACRQLGYLQGIVKKHAYFEKKSRGPVFLLRLRCNGTEKNVTSCHYTSWRNGEGDHKQDVGVICDNGHPQQAREGDVDIGASNRGPLQLYHNKTWWYVCVDVLQVPRGSVVCRQLGYRKGGYTYSMRLSTSSPMLYMKDINCTGTESRLIDCRFTSLEKSDCSNKVMPEAACYTGLFDEPKLDTFGRFVYIETSSPRQAGDKARISSPWMSSNLCMTFDYHMYGSTMSCVVIYVRQKGSSVLKPLWAKSGNRGNKWYKGMVSISINNYYQVVIEGTRGTSYTGDAALDNIIFTGGECKSTEKSASYYVINRRDQFKTETQDLLQSNGWSNVLHFEAISGTLSEQVMFVYKASTSSRSVFSDKVDMSNHDFPLDSFVSLNSSSKISLLRADMDWRQVLSYSTIYKQCCDEAVLSFGVKTMTVREPTMCGPGWYNVGSSCYRFIIPRMSWSEARLKCLQEGGIPAVFNKETLHAFPKIVGRFFKSPISLHTGISSKLTWQWSNGAHEMVTDLWGPTEPRGDGLCGSLLNANSWENTWFGWKWNDENCLKYHAYICQEKQNRYLPVAFYPLNNAEDIKDASPDPLPSGNASNIIISEGPNGKANSSCFFAGSNDSYIKLPNNGGLDLKYSMTIITWVYPESFPGPIVSYKSGLGLYLSSNRTIIARFTFMGNSQQYFLESQIIPSSSWSYIGAWYNYHTGLAGLFVGNTTVESRNISAKKELSTSSDVWLGTSSLEGGFMKGKISRVQFYDVALTDKEIEGAKDLQPESIKCSAQFTPVRGKCYHFSSQKLKAPNAKVACTNMNAHLAKIDREYIRSGIADKLDRISSKITNYFIGFEAQQKWYGEKGQEVKSSMWASGFPQSLRYDNISYVKASTRPWELESAYYQHRVEGGLCQKHKYNIGIAFQSSVVASSSVLYSSPALAVDGTSRTCLSSKMEVNPFLQIQLKQQVYIRKVTITKNKDCCRQPYTTISILATDDNNTIRSCGSAVPYGVDDVVEFYCRTPIRARFVKVVTASRQKVTLTICEAEVFSIDLSDIHGVVRQIWFSNIVSASSIKDEPIFKKKQRYEDVIESLSADGNRLADDYRQLLTTYLQVPSPGNYIFAVACDQKCEAYLSNVKEDGIGYNPSVAMQRLAYTYSTTLKNEWKKYPNQVSKPVYLNACTMYKIDVYMIEYVNDDHLSVGLMYPNGSAFEEPINTNILYNILTGERELKINFEVNSTLNVGSEIYLKGSMRYCCDGIYCIRCPLKVSLTINHRVYVLSNGLDMSCSSGSFAVNITTFLQPGVYPIQANLEFVEETFLNASKIVGNLIIKAAALGECSFTKGLCTWLRNKENNLWQISNGDVMAGKGQYASINGQYTASLESALLKWEPYHIKSGVCLQFLYMMPVNSSLSSLRVYQVEGSRQTVVWNLTGYHGERWLQARVALGNTQASKIVFNGEGDTNSTVNIAVTNIAITTQSCKIHPTYAAPGYQCKSGEFQCNNKVCMKANLKCNGDYNCLDKSDEEGCVCPVNNLLCPSGKCISTKLICDKNNDCGDSTDERNCDSPCKGFQCASGRCVDWSMTCGNQGLCQDFTDVPSICGGGSCPLNNIACSMNKTSTGDLPFCTTFISPCSFESSTCGLTLDRLLPILWTSMSGETQTPSTGPNTDHTFYSKEGKYMYVEASQRKLGDKARLVSGWSNPNNPLCLQFWYHMYGNHIGSLRILVHTNFSEQAVWEMHGNQGNMWRFGQTAVNNIAATYKFVIEGETTGGIEGDIAIDDVTLYHGLCQSILSQKTSPECDFERNNMCGWTGDNNEQWKLGYCPRRSGDCLKFVQPKNQKAIEVLSPIINPTTFKYKCLLFRYYTEISDKTALILNISIQSPTDNGTLKSIVGPEARKWLFVQLRLPSYIRKMQVVLTGVNSISIDDISFSVEYCENIPRNPAEVDGNNGGPTSSPLATTPPPGPTTLRPGPRPTTLRPGPGGNNASGKTWTYEKNTWEMTSLPVLDNFRNEYNISSEPSSNQEDVTLRSNEWIKLPTLPQLDEFTLCLWLQTIHSKFRIKYLVQDSNGAVKNGINFYHKANLDIEILDGNNKVQLSVTLPAMTFLKQWHFYCISWSGKTYNTYFYMDGKKTKSIKLDRRVYDFIPGGGSLSISTPYLRSSDTFGILGPFNIWQSIVTDHQIKQMALGCGQKSGDAMWYSRVLSSGLVNHEKRPSTCIDAGGERLLLRRNSSSIAKSLVFGRSAKSPTLCFKFVYVIYESEAKGLKIYIRYGGDSHLNLVWEDNDNANPQWRYGQFAFTAMETFQIFVVGMVEGMRGYVAFGAIYFDYNDCDHLPKQQRVFSENIIAPGYIKSPFHPGYYIRDIEYRWHIKAPVNHLINLVFEYFVLEDHVTCSEDYVQVYDGKKSPGASLGRFCGFAYQPIIKTTTNEMTLIFHSNNNDAVRRGFKARLQFIEDNSKISEKCISRKGCPSNCKCSFIKDKNNTEDKVLIEAQSLYDIPSSMPKKTFAVMFRDSNIYKIEEAALDVLSELLYLDLSGNSIVFLDNDGFSNTTTLQTLRLSYNFLNFTRYPPRMPFRRLQDLKTLDLGSNLLESLPVDIFSGLINLKVLGLRHNGIGEIPYGVFNNIKNLAFLYLQDNYISSLPDNVFEYLTGLRFLDLGNNRITKLQKDNFKGLESLKHLNLSNNKLVDVSTNAFDHLKKLEYLELDTFILCCYAKKAIRGLQECKSPSNGFSSCDDLMKNQVLRVCIWILGLMALLGNAFVIVWRVGENQKHGQVHSMLLTNLAVADFLMGVYLITIASMDMKWKGEYFKHDIEWRSGIGCRLTGMISMLSSEVSVAMLAVVTCDRLICIVFPFSTKKITKTRGIIICSFTWIVFLVASVVPIFGLNYFSTEDDDFGFYGRSSVCLPMQLSADRPAGWEYSVVFFMGFNFVAFAFMLIAYIIIFIKVKRSSATVRSTAAKRESSLARKAIFIITTDLICWMPVIIISMLSTTGLYYDPTKQVYVWIAVFVLPINSSINPYLYTFSNLNIRKKVSNKKSKVHTFIAKRFAAEAHRNRAFATDSSNGTQELILDKNSSHGQSPLMRPPISKSNEPENQPPCKYELTLIERSKVLHEDIKAGTGYLIAMVKSSASFELCMIKYFSPNLKNAWATEAAIVETLGGELHDENLLSFRWHSPVSLVSVDDSKLKIPKLEEHFLICYDFVSSTSLQDYLDNECSLTFSMVCSFAMDVITAIGYLHEKKIYHNNINTRTILIAPNSKPQNAHLKVVLSDYSCAIDMKNNLNEDKSSDIQQFAELLETLLEYCDDFEEYREINDLVFLCTHESSRNTAMIKERLSELKEASSNVWDTRL